MSAVILGSRLALRQLGALFSACSIVLAVAIVAAVALAERRAAPALAADRVFVGITFGAAIPLLAWAVVGRTLTCPLSTLARHGADRRAALLGAIAPALLLCAAGGALSALVGAVAAGARGEALTATFVGFLTGAAYAALFALGEAFATWGRSALLLADWVFGAGTTLVALPWPRSHALNLLGADPVALGTIDLPQWASSMGLVGLTVCCLAAALLRTPR